MKRLFMIKICKLNERQKIAIFTGFFILSQWFGGLFQIPVDHEEADPVVFAKMTERE